MPTPERKDTLDAGPPLTEEQWALVLGAMPKLPREAVIRWGVGLRGLTRDELYQAAVDGLIRAAQKYDPARGVLFATYARLWVDQKCQVWHRLFRRRLKSERPVSSLAANETEDGMYSDGILAAYSREPDPAEAACRSDEQARARAEAARLLGALPPRWAQALWLVCGQGYLLREAGEVLGVNRERVRQLVSSARRELAKHFEGVRLE